MFKVYVCVCVLRPSPEPVQLIVMMGTMMILPNPTMLPQSVYQMMYVCMCVCARLGAYKCNKRMQLMYMCVWV